MASRYWPTKLKPVAFQAISYSVGWTLTGLGAIGAGVGAYLWMHQNKPTVAVVPTLTGLALVGQF